MIPAISFHYPQLLILLLLLPLVWRSLTSRRLAASSILRMALAALAILALAGPRLGMTSPDTDLVILVDRSASCGAESGRMLREIWPLIKKAEKPGDRSAVVAFGDGALVERAFAAETAGTPAPDGFEFASNLAAALRLAAGMRSPDRRTAVLCLSDGLYTGVNPLDPDVVSDLESLPVWHRRLGGGGGVDVAAGDIATPEEVEPRSAWIVRFTIHADAPCETDYVLSRNGLAVSGGKAKLKRGPNHFFARDTADSDGLLEYRLDTTTAGDTRPENNRSSALLRVRGAPKVLLATSAAEPGIIEKALAAASIPVERVAPEAFPEAAAKLAPYKLVILENCQLSNFPGRGVASLAAAVEEGLCSLLVTGGPNSFGMGGYHRSALDPLLPVEMELRNETRRGSMAIAIALDRSGSMAMSAGGGRTKMDLANTGAAESIRLLSPHDQVAVIAVDSSPHIIVPLSMADDVEKLVQLTLGVQSMGGGIFCYQALKAAEAEVVKSTLPNRHILLFADAADAEEQEGCIELVKRLNRDGIKTSVIAMGTPADSDADFLKEVARLGGGESLFSNYADGLPALFTQEIMRISKRGFIEEAITPRLLPALSMLGLERPPAAPRLDGFNVSAARDGATAYMDLNDEFSTPAMASRISGKAATGAVLFEVDGEYSGTFANWPEAPGLLVALARRLASGVSRAEVKAYSGLERGMAETVLEFSPDAARRIRSGDARVKWIGPGGMSVESSLEWFEPEKARARARLAVPGHYLPLADLPGLGLAAAPPVTLPYSSEFMPGTGRDGLAVLRDLAELTGGGDGLDISEVRHSAKAARTGILELRPYLLFAIMLLFLLELSGRRLLWFS